MATNRAITTITTGKGGVGKTTLLSILIAETLALPLPDDAPILVIDGDPDQSLALTLGISDPDVTLANIRDEKFDARTLRASGMSMADYVRTLLESKGVLQTVQVNGRDIDFMAMGRSKETGCYCAVNNALAQVFDEIKGKYAIIFIDSPAGTEHLNRYRITKADFFVVVSGISVASLKVRERIMETAERVNMEMGRVIDIINHSRGLLSASSNGAIHIPYDEMLAEYAMKGQSLAELPADNAIRVNLREIAREIVGAVS